MAMRQLPRASTRYRHERMGGVKGREAINEAINLLSHNMNLNADQVMAYTMLGVSLLSVGRHDEAVTRLDRESELAPGSYYAPRGRGIVLGYCDEPSEIASIRCDSPTVSPRDPRIYATYQARCATLFVLNQFERSWHYFTTHHAALTGLARRLNHAKLPLSPSWANR